MREVTMCCTTCPSGCALNVTVDENGDILDIQGNKCPRGIKFAHGEWTDPVRTLTSTVYVVLNGQQRLMPVKTQEPISKLKMGQAMDEINALVIDHPVVMGDVILNNIADTGIALVACKTMKQ